MAFDDLTPEQRRAMIELAAALRTGHYETEFFATEVMQRGPVFLLAGRGDRPNHEIRGLPQTEFLGLGQEGYLNIVRQSAREARASFKPKAAREYEYHLAERNSDAYYERVWLDVFHAAGGNTERPVDFLDALRGEAADSDELWRLARVFEGRGWFKVEADNGPPYGRLTQRGLEAAARFSQGRRQTRGAVKATRQRTSEMRQTLQEWAGAAEGEGRQLSLVFTDVVRSTAMAQMVGDEKWLEIISAHFRRAHKLADEHQGFVIKLIGDACMVAFRGSVGAYNFTTAFYLDPGHPDLSIRAAINTGHVYMMGDDIFGMMINLTARIQKLIDGYGIVVSEQVAKDLRHAFGKDSPKARLRLIQKEIPDFNDERAYRVMTREIRLADAERVKRARAAAEAEAALKPAAVKQSAPPTSQSGIRPRAPNNKPKWAQTEGIFDGLSRPTRPKKKDGDK
jgi:class 3 adenylate cyclase